MTNENYWGTDNQTQQSVGSALIGPFLFGRKPIAHFSRWGRAKAVEIGRQGFVVSFDKLRNRGR